MAAKKIPLGVEALKHDDATRRNIPTAEYLPTLQADGEKLPHLPLLGDMRQLIDAARQRAVATINSELMLLYWRIDLRIHAQALEGQRPKYGKEVIATRSQLDSRLPFMCKNG